MALSERNEVTPRRGDRRWYARAGQHRKRITVIISVSVLLLLSAGLLWWRGFGQRSVLLPPAVKDDWEKSDQPTEHDPRLAYARLYPNLHPDVPYVGDARCASCHEQETASYHRHPMAHSLVPLSGLLSERAFNQTSHKVFTSAGRKFRVNFEDGHLRHSQRLENSQGESVYDLGLEAHYVIGSGARGVSYLMERDGYLFQTPISWFSHEQLWERSPGFAALNAICRPVDAECLFCHANRAHLHEGSKNHYDAPIFTGHAIGCERCHGPGGKHVESLAAADIINPRKLPIAAREAVCQQCHLAGDARVLRRGRQLYDFRPGLPVEELWSVFVLADNGTPRKAVSHVEQLAASRCYSQSPGDARLGCISCHNPHDYVTADRKAPYYRDRCLACHKDRGCSLPKARRLEQADNCVACHMPRRAITDVAHTAATDHRIVRSLDAPPPPGSSFSSEAPPGGNPWASLPAIPFRTGPLSPLDGRLAREAGIGLVMLAASGKIDGMLHGDRARTFLDYALARDATDLEAREARVNLLVLQRRPEEALSEIETILTQRPRRESALVWAGVLSDALGKSQSSLAYWQRAVEVNPWMAEYHEHLATRLLEQGRWPEAAAHSQSSIGLNPENVAARLVWIKCLLQEGKTTQAAQEFAKLEALQPPNLSQLKMWFEGLSHPGHTH